VSIPDDVFEGAERLARHSRKSRSQLYSDALREYVSRHSADEAIEAWNNVIEKVKPVTDGFVTEAARRTLEQSDW
jgi:metal-responsive CopG/Arc/MetJ family transcriptional regulator